MQSSNKAPKTSQRPSPRSHPYERPLSPRATASGNEHLADVTLPNIARCTSGQAATKGPEPLQRAPSLPLLPPLDELDLGDLADAMDVAEELGEPCGLLGECLKTLDEAHGRIASCAGGGPIPRDHSQYLRTVMMPETHTGYVPDLNNTPVVLKKLNSNSTFTTGGTQDLLFVPMNHSSTPRVMVFSSVVTASTNAKVGEFLPCAVYYPEEDVALSYNQIRFVSGLVRLNLMMAYGGNNAISGMFTPIECANVPPFRLAQASKANAYAINGMRDGPYRIDDGIVALSAPRIGPLIEANPKFTGSNNVQMEGGNSQLSFDHKDSKTIVFTGSASNWTTGAIANNAAVWTWLPDSLTSATSPAIANTFGPLHFRGTFTFSMVAPINTQCVFNLSLKAVRGKCSTAGIVTETSTTFLMTSVTESSATASTAGNTLQWDHYLTPEYDSTLLRVEIINTQGGYTTVTPVDGTGACTVTSIKNNDTNGNINMIFLTGVSSGLPINVEQCLNLEAYPNSQTAAQVKTANYTPPNLLEAQMTEAVFANREASGVSLFYSSREYDQKIQSGWMDNGTRPERLYAHCAGFLSDIYSFLKPGFKAIVPGASRALTQLMGRPDLESSLTDFGQRAFTRGRRGEEGGGEEGAKYARCMNAQPDQGLDDLEAVFGSAREEPAPGPKASTGLAKLKLGSKDPSSRAIVTHVAQGTVSRYYEAMQEKHGVASVQNHFPGVLDDGSAVLFTVAVSTGPYPEQAYVQHQVQRDLEDGPGVEQAVFLNRIAQTNFASILATIKTLSLDTIVTFQRAPIYVTIVGESDVDGITEDSYSLAFAASLMGAPVEAVLTGIVTGDNPFYPATVSAPGALAKKAALARDLGLKMITGDIATKFFNSALSVRTRRVDNGKPGYCVEFVTDVFTIIGYINSTISEKVQVAKPRPADKEVRQMEAGEGPETRNEFAPVTVDVGDGKAYGVPSLKSKFVINSVDDARKLLVELDKSPARFAFNIDLEKNVALVPHNADDEPITKQTTGKTKRVVAYYGTSMKASFITAVENHIKNLRDRTRNAAKSKASVGGPKREAARKAWGDFNDEAFT